MDDSRDTSQVDVLGANNRVERTAAMHLDFDGDELQTAVVAVVSTLPAAVAHPCR